MTAPPQPPDPLDELDRGHPLQNGLTADSDWCGYCLKLWPCDAMRAVTIARAATERAARAEQRADALLQCIHLNENHPYEDCNICRALLEYLAS